MQSAVEHLFQLSRERATDPAVADGRTCLTFGELARAASGCADQLGDLRPGSVVVVLGDSRVETVVAALGVWWAGAGVTVLDAAEPRERLEEIIERSGAALVLDAVGVGLGSLAGVPVMVPERRIGDVAAPRTIAPNDVSSLKFTSGSTGRPKGVIYNSTQDDFKFVDYLNDPEIPKELGTALLVPPYYAWGFIETMDGVCSGRFTLLLDIRRDDAATVTAEIERWGVGRLVMTPSLARLLPGLIGRGQRMPGIRRATLGGEVVNWPDIEAARSLLPEDATICCAFGASETLVQAFRHYVGPDEPTGVGRAPLGTLRFPQYCKVEPVDGLDGIGQLVVYDAVTEGYIGDEAMTADRYGVAEGRRFWRSGDLVGQDADGLWHHRGRVDSMVKIGGRLVEPAEAEAALLGHPGVSAAVVMVRSLPSGRQQLVAHVETPASTSVSALREALRQRLPNHLVPAVFFRYDSLPISEKGKINRSALLIDAASPWRDERDPVPETGLTRLIRPLVASVLGIPDLRDDDVLWDVGCDSLAAIEICEVLVNAFATNLTPSDLITARTMQELADRLGSGATSERSHVMEIHPDAASTPVAVVMGAGAPALMMRDLFDASGTDQPWIIFEQFGLHQRRQPDRTIRAMAERNVRELRKRQPAGPYVIVGQSFGGLVAHEMTHVLQRMGEQAVPVLLDTFRVPNQDYARGLPLVRPANLRTRQVSWPIHLAKLLRWRAAAFYNRGPVFRWRNVRVGTPERYDLFGRHAVNLFRRHRVRVLDTPVWLVHPAGAITPSQWADHPQLVCREVPGGHLSMAEGANARVLWEVIAAAADAASMTRVPAPAVLR